jgi:hypothetical protein
MMYCNVQVTETYLMYSAAMWMETMTSLPQNPRIMIRLSDQDLNAQKCIYDQLNSCLFVVELR